MQLAHSFNAVANAILIVKASGDYTKNGRYLKIVAGSKEMWEEEIFPRYASVDYYVATEWEREWIGRHGHISSGCLDVNWAENLSADAIPYDGKEPLSEREQEAVTALSSGYDLTLDVLWAAVEGMNWRPASGRQPPGEQIRAFHDCWRSWNTERLDATTLALMLTLFRNEIQLDILEKKAGDLIREALAPLRIPYQ